jgi:enoyl-CoA hydratase/carnithine racemase
MRTVSLSQVAGGVRWLTLNRPDHLNALTAQLVADFGAALDEVDRDSRCRVMILTGAGRAFCAGIDLHGYGDDELVASQGTARRFMTRQAEIAGLAQRLHSLRQPVIAAINGPAAGGGLAFALASDIRIAAADAVFAVSFIRAGYSGCDIGTSWLLPRIVGAGRAHELMLTGRRCGADEALQMGLVASVVTSSELASAAQAKAEEIMQNPPLSVELTKQGMWLAMEIPSFDAVIALENRQQFVTGSTEDQAEATAAFLQKRPPRYRDR